MPFRKDALEEGNIYHIFNKSIAGFKIFNTDNCFERMRKAISFYSSQDTSCKFSAFLELKEKKDNYNSSKKIVKILAYCLMPTHIHLILQQLTESGISIFMNRILQSYTKYFNIKYKRKGPLWEGRFKNVLVETDEQLLHLTRYIHLNPVTAFLIATPREWKFSSYKEYLGEQEKDRNMCEFLDYMDVNSKDYEQFVNDQIDYQRELAKIKDLLLETFPPSPQWRKVISAGEKF